MGEHGQCSWHTHSLPLGLSGTVLTADVAADAEASLRVAAVTEGDLRAVHIMHTSGDPTLGEFPFHGWNKALHGAECHASKSSWTQHSVARALSDRLSRVLRAFSAVEGAGGALQIISDTIVPTSADVTWCRLHGNASSGAHFLCW